MKVNSWERLTGTLFKLSLGSNRESIARSLVSEPLNLFIYFLSEHIVRFHYTFAENFDLNVNPLLDFSVYENLTEINVVAERTSPMLSLRTGSIKVLVNKEALRVSVYDADGDLLSEDLSQAGFYSTKFFDGGSEFRIYKTYKNIERPPLVYGLGDKTGELNRWGRRFINKPVDALGYDSSNSDPLYKDIPFFIVLDRDLNKAHGIFLDNFSEKFFDFGKERKPSPYYYFGAKSGDLNYYYIHGPELSEISQRFIELTGKPSLQSGFVFGYLGSGMAYTEKDNSTEELISYVKRHQAKNIYPRAFHLSSGYILNEKNERLQFIWNKKKFPEPKSFVENLRNLGVELCVNLKPVLLKSHPFYDEADSLGLFIQEANAAAEPTGKQDSLLVDYWSGEGSYLDFTKAETQVWWKQKIKEYLLDKGVRGIWNDNNEYEIFVKNNQTHKTMIMPNLMSKLAYEALEETYSDISVVAKEGNLKQSHLRPWVLSRSGYAGLQKYAQTWTGDNCSSFTALKYDVPIISSMGISGLIHSGCDIGGFWGDEPSPELLLRWIQLGVFSPRFTIHSYKEKPTEVLNLASDLFQIAQSFMALREKLRPYIYQANYLASNKAIPIQRPLVYDFQTDLNVCEESFSYVFGESLLVVPVTDFLQEVSQKITYLPALENDAKWIDFFNFDEYVSGKEYSYPLDLSSIPVFVKANSVIPLLNSSSQPCLQANVKEDSVGLEPLIFRIFVDTQELQLKKKIVIHYQFYEDDENTTDYLEGFYLLREFEIEIELLEDKPHIKIQQVSYQGLLKSRYIINIECVYASSLHTILGINLS